MNLKRRNSPNLTGVSMRLKQVRCPALRACDLLPRVRKRSGEMEKGRKNPRLSASTAQFRVLGSWSCMQEMGWNSEEISF